LDERYRFVAAWMTSINSGLLVCEGEMRISEFVQRLADLQAVTGDVEVIIKPFYDELPYELAAAESVNVVEGRSERGERLWIDNFEKEDPRVTTVVRVY
jgi:hypothetical protein